VFFDQLLAGAGDLPTVAGATLTSRPPLAWQDQNGRFDIEGRSEGVSETLCCVASPVHVGTEFFETMGVPLLRGRLLEAGDHRPDAPGVVVIDQAAADRWWPGEEPLGQRIRFGRVDGPWSTVIGVVENVTYDGPGEIWPTFYLSHNWTAEAMPHAVRSGYLTVRTIGDPSRVLPSVREAVGELDPNLAIAASYTMEEVMDRAVARPRFIMSLLSIFAGVALALGAIGVYGVMAYGVALRAGEIGIRRALGAESGAVVRMILGQGFVLAALGLGLGLAAALAGTRVLEGFLHGVSPTDPLTFVLVGIGVILVALAATYAPARKAGGVDPLDALRVE
jgi:putative ABC transport system permease protein